MRGVRVLAVALLLACGEPSITNVTEPRGLIEGTLVYPNGGARGNVYLFLYRQDDPPPPVGFGRPVSFIAVSRQQLFQGAPPGQRTTFSTGFTIPSVPKGRYELRAFLDADGNFNPSYELLAQPTAGDVIGGFVDAEGRLVTVEVEAGARNASQVIVTLARELPVERPAFQHLGAVELSTPLVRPASLVLEARAFRRGSIQMAAERSRFLVQLTGRGEDGRALDEDGDHLPDVYPRVLLRRIETETSTRTVIVPLIANPLPFLDDIETQGFALAERLELIVPPVAVELDGRTRRRLPNVPLGDYETIVLSGTGQTWRIPNDLESLFPGDAEPSQSVVVRVTEGPAPPAGRIRGALRVPGASAAAEAYVFAFAEAAPPPPEGLGRPVAVAAVPRAAFVSDASGWRAPFELHGLLEGRYHLAALFDTNSSFAPLVEWLAEPDAGDWLGRSTEPVAVGAEGVELRLGLALPLDRPGFSLPEEVVVGERAVSRLLLSARPEPRLSMRAELTRFEVRLRSVDETGDNLPELYPRVLLTRLAETSDPRTALEESPPVVVPAFVDPLPFLPALDAGAAEFTTEILPIILPPVALEAGALRLGIPPGRYRVNLIAASGQTWRLPNASELALGRADGEREDLSQARFVTVEASPAGGGRIEGGVFVPGVLGPRASVVIAAFREEAPPPPEGRGRPVASARLLPSAIAGGTGSYALEGLPSGRYQVRAFVDRNGDFVPWYATHDQPTQGDVPGGHFVDGRLASVTVDGLGPATSGVDVRFVEAAFYAYDRPVFELPEGLVLDAAGPPLSVTLYARRASSAVLRADGLFPMRWVDLDGDGIADDLNADGVPDVFPLVVAERLDDADPEGLTLAEPAERIFAAVPLGPLAGTGFPVGDTTATSTVVERYELTAAFPPVSVKAGGEVGAPTPGRYRVTLVNDRGQTWTVPNVLSRALGDPMQAGQGRALTVRGP